MTLADDSDRMEK